MNDGVEFHEARAGACRGFGAPPPVKPFESGIRGAALIIANWEYRDRPLSGPQQDLPLIEAAFRANRFDVTPKANVRRPERLLDHVSNFVDRILRSAEPQHGGFAGPVFVYFAGHGAKSPSDGRNYVLPVNVDQDSFLRDPLAAVSLDDLTHELQRLKGFAVTLVLDACRATSATRGASAASLSAFGRVSNDRADDMRGAASGGPAWLGLVFSTQPGDFAADTLTGTAGYPSPFAYALVRCLRSLRWRLQPRRVDEFFSQDVQKAFSRLPTASRGTRGGEQSIAVAVSHKAGHPPPVIGADLGRRFAATSAGLLAGALALSVLVWHNGAQIPKVPPDESPNPAMDAAPSNPGPVQPTTVPFTQNEPPPAPRPQEAATIPPQPPPAPAPAGPSSPPEQDQRLRGRVQFAAAREAFDKGDMVIAAGLALSAIDLPAFSADTALRSEAAQLLYRAQLGIGKPEAAFAVPGIPEEGGEFYAPTAFSRDGTQFAIQAGTSKVRVFDTTTGSVIASVEPPPETKKISFSDDGRLLLYGMARPSPSAHVQCWNKRRVP